MKYMSMNTGSLPSYENLWLRYSTSKTYSAFRMTQLHQSFASLLGSKKLMAMPIAPCAVTYCCSGLRRLPGDDNSSDIFPGT
jgi:hypothetical protein